MTKIKIYLLKIKNMDKINILEQHAINAAINNSWQKAINLNLQIIKLDKKNIDAYLRLGFAFLQLKKIKEAEKYYKKVLKIQPNNQTATENLDRIKILAGKKLKETSITLNPDLFLDIPGRTKSVVLVNPGQKNILAQLSVGQEVFLKIKKRRVEIRTITRDYIGCLPDDLSRRISVLIKAGSNFTAHIKEATLKRVVVFLREVNRGKKVSKYLPLPINIQSTLTTLAGEKNDDGGDTDELEEELTDADLERLAQDLEIKEKEDYLSFSPIENDEVEEE